MNTQTNTHAPTTAKPANRSRTATRMMCEGAILVCMAQILSYLKLVEFPFGGSLTPAMFPLILFAVRWGLGQGLLAGFVFGVLQFMFDGGFAIGWQSIIGDYLVAFTALGLAGVFKGRRWGIYAGAALGCGARLLVHYVVGATVWAQYMPEEFFGMTMTSPWIYSILYNGAYMLPNIALCLAIAALGHAPLRRFYLGADIPG